MSFPHANSVKKVLFIGFLAAAALAAAALPLSFSQDGFGGLVAHAQEGESGGGCGGCGGNGDGNGGVPGTPPPPPPPPPTCSLYVSPSSVLPGGASTLYWTSTDAEYTDIHNVLASFSDDMTAASYPPHITDYGRPWGNAVVHPTYSRTYTVTFYGPGGNVTCLTTIIVSQPPPPTPAPSCTISANPTKVKSGENATLTWTSQNAATASLNQGIGAVVLNGNQNVGPLTATTTYTLTVTGNGSATCNTEIGVILPPPPPPPTPPSCVISANPSSVYYKGSSTLNWTSQNATGASIDQNIGSVPVNGSRAVSYITSTKTYTLTITGGGGTATCSTTVTVIPKPKTPTCTLSAYPTTVKSGENTTLTWSSQYATAVSIDQGIGSVALSGSQSTPSITKETKFTLTANGEGGTAKCYVTVKLKSACTKTYSRYTSCY